MTSNRQQPSVPSVPVTVQREVWLAGDIHLEVVDAGGQVYEVGLSAEQQQHQRFLAGEQVWLTALNMETLSDWSSNRKRGSYRRS